jgi:hypothetical protein
MTGESVCVDHTMSVGIGRSPAYGKAQARIEKVEVPGHRDNVCADLRGDAPRQLLGKSRLVLLEGGDPDCRTLNPDRRMLIASDDRCGSMLSKKSVFSIRPPPLAVDWALEQAAIALTLPARTLTRALRAVDWEAIRGLAVPGF